jgi:hypothetical protein
MAEIVKQICEGFYIGSFGESSPTAHWDGERVAAEVALRGTGKNRQTAPAPVIFMFNKTFDHFRVLGDLFLIILEELAQA